MKLNNKGFALTSMIYMLIVLFLMILLLVLSNLASRKVVLDKLKYDVKNRLEQNVPVNSQGQSYLNLTTGMYYSELEVAINKASNNDVIKVLKDVVDTSTPVVSANKSVKIDLAGNLINLGNRLTNNGTLDIYSSVDGGSIISLVNSAIRNENVLTFNGTSGDHSLFIFNNSTSRSETYSIIDNDSGSLTLNGNVTVKYSNQSTTGNSNRNIITNKGTVTVNGATLENKMDDRNNEHGINNETGATNSSIIVNSGLIDVGGNAIVNVGSTKSTTSDPAMKVAGGTLKSSKNIAAYNYANGMFYITGGEIYSTGANTIQNNGNLSMTGGTVYAYQGTGVLTTGSGNTVVSGGLITKAKNPVTNAWQGGACFQINNNSNATITGTAVVQNESGNSSNVIYNSGSGTLTIDGNAIVENKGSVLTGTNANSGKIVINGGTVKSNGSRVIDNNYASSTSTSYGTIEVNGGTVVTTGTSSCAIYNASASSYAHIKVTNGSVSSQHSITINNTGSYGNIEITGGTITSNRASENYGTVYSVKPNSTIKVSGGTINSNTGYTAIFNGGSDSSIDISGGNISANGSANNNFGTVYTNQPNTTITISGGTISRVGTNYPLYIASSATNSTTTMTGGELSMGGDTAIYNRGTGATVTIGTQGAVSNTYPKITGRIWGDGASDSDRSGLITVNSGTITGATTGTASRAQAIFSKNDVIVNGGVLSASRSYGIISNSANSKITVNGGDISSNNTFAVTTTNTLGGQIEINGGTMNSTTSSSTINNTQGSTVIKGGIISSQAGIGVQATSGTITIGDSSNAVSTISPSITGKTYGVRVTTGSINFYDGVIIGQNGSGSSLSGNVSVPNGYDRKIILDGTNETSTLKPVFVMSGAATVLDASNHGTTAGLWAALAGVNGTISNATWGTNYLEFNGTNSSVNLGRMDYSEQSVEATISLDEQPSGNGYFIANLESGGVGLTTLPSGKVAALFGTLKADGTGNSYNNINSKTILELGKSYHICLTYDGAKIKLYINGVLDTEKTPVNTTVKNTDSQTVMALGGNPSGSNVVAERFKGKIYSAAVYNRALSLTEVRQNAVAGMYIAGENLEFN